MRGTGTTVTVTRRLKNFEITYLETATPDNQGKVLKILTEKNDGMQLNVALNYGGRDEIVRASRKIVNHVLSGKIDKEHIDEKLFSKFLDTGDIKYPDLIIRTAGEKRLSNFLLWQSAYSELYFSQKMWPDFNENDLIEALEVYKHRARKFGNLIDKKKSPQTK